MPPGTAAPEDGRLARSDRKAKPGRHNPRGRFEVRFAPVSTLDASEHVTSVPSLRPRQIKDRSGCFPCKRRKIKCDESLPTCRHCTRRKEICLRPTTVSASGGALWRLPDSVAADRGVQLPDADWGLLHHWFNCAFRILCNLPGQANPFANSLLEVLLVSPAALFTFQSLSAAFQGFFETQSMPRALEQRGRALACLRQELGAGASNETTLLVIVVIGISSGWFADDLADFGREHLLAASAVVESLLVNFDEKAQQSPLFYLAMGMYMHWDMACSFLAPLHQLPVRKPALVAVAKHIDRLRPPHPVLGVSTELFLIVGSAIRLYRRLQDSGQRDIHLEAELERRLLDWESPRLDPAMEAVIETANYFRFTGLVVLYGINKTPERRQQIGQWIRFILQKLHHVSGASPYFGYECFILTMIGGEVTEPEDRAIIVSLFRQLHEHNRLHVNHRALELLQETWALHDAGRQASLLQVMECKGWRLMMG